MKNGWQKIKLNEVVEQSRQLYEPIKKENLPYLGLEHIDQQTLSINSIGNSSETQSTKKIFRDGDILFGTLRPYFRKVVKPKFSGVCSTDITVLRAKAEFEQDYLFYFIASENFIEYATKISYGTKMPRANWEKLSESEWVFPPKPYQKRITSILSTYDDLIENNTRRIKILEEMARLIYCEWFVEFKAPGIKLRKATPEEKKVTGKDLFPEGWEVKKLEEVATITMGQSPESKHYNETGEGLPFHQGVTDFGDRFPTDRVFTTVQNRIAEEGDILFSVRAPVGRINIATKKMILGRGLSGIRSKSEQQELLFQQLKESFKEEDTMGGGTIFKSVTKNDMLSIRFIQPNEKCVKLFQDQAKPIFKELSLLTKQNTNLRQTRDFLLPKLISGEVEV